MNSTTKLIKLYFPAIIVFLMAVVCYLSPIDLLPKIQAAGNDFVLAWSSNSYAPIEYEGKALPSRGSSIKAVALPTKKLAQNPDLLYYRWLLDNEIAYEAQGRGKSYFQFQVTKWGGYSHEIKCQILDNRENTIWQGTLTVKIVNPQVLFKPSNSNYAAFNSIKTSTGKDLTITALPLFFHAQKPSDLTFNWAIDNKTLPPPDEKEPDPNVLMLKIPSGNLIKSVFKNLSLSVKNKNDRLQIFAASLNIEIK